MMCGRQRAVHVRSVCELACERAERDELAHEDVAVAVGVLEAAAG
jgi:hypothetical protein